MRRAVLMKGPSMKLPAYEVLAQASVAEGVDTVFTLMGDANMYWANAMARHNGVRLVHIRHEHCAVAAAASYTWATGRPGLGQGRLDHAGASGPTLGVYS
jgi:glyoxylate carboligase